MIGKKSFLIVGTHYISDILGFVGLIILSKLWGDFAPEALGIIGFAMSSISLFNIITDFGFSSAHIKRISEGKDLGTCIGTFIAVKVLLTFFMIVVVFTSIFIWKNFFNGTFYDATTETVVIIMVVYSIFNNLQNIAIQTFIGKREIAKLQTTRLTENIVKLPLTIIVALAGVRVMGYAISPAVQWPEFLQPLQRFLSVHATGSLAFTYVFALMATTFVGMWFLRRDPIKRPSLALAKNYFKFALPIALNSVIATIAQNVDKVMIGYFWASAEVGYYFAFQRVIGFINVLYISVATILFPTISKQYSEKNISGVKRTVHLAERYISMVLIPPLVIVFVFTKPAINIFLDSSFLPATSVFILLVVHAYIRGMSTPYTNLITGMNRPDIAAKIGVIVCVTNIILNYLIIPKNGILSNIYIGGLNLSINGAPGAAFATVLSFLITFIGSRLIAKKLTGIKLLQTHTPRHIIAGFFMGISLYLLAYNTSLFPVIRWYTLLGFCFIGLAIYIIILILLKEFSKKDFKFFLDSMHPKEMVNYVKSELRNNKKKK
jgi:O-antigen/teichoic acid export membrane protein